MSSEPARSVANRFAGFWWLLAALLGLLGAYAPAPWVQLGIIVGLSLAVLVQRRSVWSLRPFFFSLFAAGLFVAIRMAYTALFAGTATVPTEGTVLWVLPQVWLPGPFSSIHLFGTMTAEALLAAAVSATRFAVVFVAFGAANTLADPRELLQRMPKSLLGVTGSLAVALSVFPSLTVMAKRVRRASLLRGLRTRWLLVTPLLEQAVERAQALGVSMASRGWGLRTQTPTAAVSSTATNVPRQPGFAAPATAPLVNAPLVFAGVTVSFGDTESTEPVLRDVRFELSPGTITVISGATGVGKSTLLQVARGTLAHDEIALSGEVLVFGHPAHISRNVGFTVQRAETSFVTATVRQELEFGAQQHGLSAAEAAGMLAVKLGLTHLLDRNIEQLSAGEAALVSVAAACSSQPKLLLLDEPIADLDQRATEYLLCMLRELRDDGTTILIAEHKPSALLGVADAWFELSNGTLRTAAPPKPEPAFDPSSMSRSAPLTALTEHPGKITALFGPNGCGKTTLLEQIAFTGKRANADVALLGYSVDDFLIRASVTDECQLNDRAHKRAPGTTEALVRRFLPQLTNLDVHPRDLSAGSRVVLALCLQLALARSVLLLDEPTRGLDRAAREKLAEVLREVAQRGTAVVFATHDTHFVTQTADVLVQMTEGGVIVDAS